MKKMSFVWDSDLPRPVQIKANALLYDRLEQHCGHNVSIVKYGLGVGCYTLECNDCNEIIMDTDTYKLEGLK